jgi:hypothetical protein
VEIDALETFISSLRTALREYHRAQQGDIPRKGGRPGPREAAAAAFRLVKFEIGSGIATLAPVVGTEDGEEMSLDDNGQTLALTTLRQMLDDLDSDAGLAEPVVEALGYAQRSIGDDGHFGIKLVGLGDRPRRILIDEKRITELRRAESESDLGTVTVIGRLHLIEAEVPNRRVAIRAQAGIDWTCTYPDVLHDLVTKQLERLVRVTGHGRRVTANTGRLTIEVLDPISEHAQDPLFTEQPVPIERLRAASSKRLSVRRSSSGGRAGRRAGDDSVRHHLRQRRAGRRHPAGVAG